MKRILALVIAGLLLYSLTISLTNVVTDSGKFVDIEYGTLASKYASWSDTYTQSFTVSGVKPQLSTSEFNVPFTYTVKWDGIAVASAFVPAVLEDYMITDPSNPSNYIIYKKPTIVGLSAIFRGSEYKDYLPDGTYISDTYAIGNGTLYISYQVGQYVYTYSVTIFSTVRDENVWITSAWAQAKAGLSTEFKLMNFISASLDLAEVGVGVQTSIVKVVSTTNGYQVTVSFSIPTYKIQVNYLAKADILHTYYVKSPQPYCPVSVPVKDLQGINPLGCVYSSVELKTLKAVGSFIGYTKMQSLVPWSQLYLFNGNYATGMIVFRQ